MIRPIKKRLHRILLIGFLTALSSEIYFSMLVDNFRISPAVIVFPVLLVTLAKEDPVPLVGLGTGAVVFCLRLLLALPGSGLEAALIKVFPGAFFYIVYSVLFPLLVLNRYTASIQRISLAACCCDFCSNCIELLLRYLLQPDSISSGSLLRILLVAVIRGILVFAILLINRQYHFLLKKSEHEERYRQLFLLTANLKSELYLMKKNSEQIEGVMKEAYGLYEQLKEMRLEPELQNAGLQLASKVHDVKKDYYRVIQGIEEELVKDPDNGAMAIKDLFRILTEACRTEIRDRNQNTLVTTRIDWPFETPEHYALMSILLNLVNNAVEALDGKKSQGRIIIQESLEEGDAVFRVRDNGSGISPRRLPHIFDMGYSSKFNEVTGNIYRGVGLASVKQLTEEQLGGRIEVESVLNEGTCFTVRIPASRLTGDKK